MNYIHHLTNFYACIEHDTSLTPCHISLYMALFQYWNLHRFQDAIPIYRENLMRLSRIGSKNTYHKCLKELHQAHYIKCHPPSSKFQPIKITMLPLDQKEKKGAIKLSLFSIPEKSPARIKTETHQNTKTSSPKTNTVSVPNLTEPCLYFDTAQVPNLTEIGLHFDTDTVPKVGRNIKLNYKHINSVCNTPTKILKKNKKNIAPINDLARVPKTVQEQINQPSITEIENFFHQSNYPPEEAKKFYYYNQSKNWLLQKNIPITNWQAAANKWILNIKNFTHNQNTQHNDLSSNSTETDKNYTEPL